MSFDPRDFLLRKCVVFDNVLNMLESDSTMSDVSKFQTLYAVGIPVLGDMTWEPRILPHRMLLLEVYSAANLQIVSRKAWWFDDSGLLQKVSIP